MPRKMMGPGSAAMGGGGKKPPPMPSTPFGGPAQGMAPGGSMTGAMPRSGRGGPRGAPSTAMAGGGGGFKKGGEVKEKVHKHEKGGAVHGDEKEDRKLFHKMEKEEDKRPGKREREEEKHEKYAHGGPVLAGHSLHGLKGTPHTAGEGISRGTDSKRSAGPHGADSRVHKPHSGKAS